MKALTDMLSRLTAGRALLIGLILAAFYYYFMFDKGLTQKANIAQSQARMQEINTQIEDAEGKLRAAAVYKKTASEVGSTVNKLVSLIPTQFGMSDLMRIVSNEAKVSGSSLASIEPKSTEVSKLAREFEELSVTADMSGSFLQHMVFLSNLTKINQILIVRKLSFSSEKEAHGDEAPVVKMNAEIVAFRYRGPVKDEVPQ